MHIDVYREAPATLVWLETGVEPQPDLFDGPAGHGPHGPEHWDHLWVAVSYVMNIDWRDGHEPWIRVAEQILRPAALRDMYRKRVGKRP